MKLKPLVSREPEIDRTYLHFFEAGRTAGAVDRFLGQVSPNARICPIPGYAEGYAKGLRGE
jgi:hypothetical protein